MRNGVPSTLTSEGRPRWRSGRRSRSTSADWSSAVRDVLEPDERGSPSRARRRPARPWRGRAATAAARVGDPVDLDAAAPTRPRRARRRRRRRRRRHRAGGRGELADRVVLGRRDARRARASRRAPRCAEPRTGAGAARTSPARPASSSGFALYASLSTVTPSGRLVSSIRQARRSCALASAVATVRERDAARCNATAAAWAALVTWCAPRDAGRSRLAPPRRASRNVGRSRRRAGRRTCGPRRRHRSPTVSTGAGLRRRSVSRYRVSRRSAPRGRRPAARRAARR